MILKKGCEAFTPKSYRPTSISPFRIRFKFFFFYCTFNLVRHYFIAYVCRFLFRLYSIVINGENKKEWITEEIWANVEEIAKIRTNYSVQNLKGSLNESKRITTIRKLRRIPDETRELTLINWQRRLNRLPTNVI